MSKGYFTLRICEIKCNIKVNMLSWDVKVTKIWTLSTADQIEILALIKLLRKITTTTLRFWKKRPNKKFIGTICCLKLLTINFICVHVLNDVAIPLSVNSNATLYSHDFVEDCKITYAACVFTRTRDSSVVKLTLLRAKARVAPLKNLSIPRSELVSGCISTR